VHAVGYLAYVAALPQLDRLPPMVTRYGQSHWLQPCQLLANSLAATLCGIQDCNQVFWQILPSHATKTSQILLDSLQKLFRTKL
jgi:hypothetical protein